MTEPELPTPALPQAPPPDRVQVGAPPPPRRSLAPVAYLAGLAVLCLALFVLWRYPANEPAIAESATRLDMLERQVRQLSDRLATAENRPAPAPVDLRPVEARLAQLEQRPQPAPAASPNDVAALLARIDAVAARQDALAGRQTNDVTGLTNKVDGAQTALDGRIQAAQAGLEGRLQAGQQALESRVAALQTNLEGKIQAGANGLDDKLGASAARLEARIGTLDSRAGAIDARLAVVEQAQAQFTGLAARSQVLARLQSATAALEQGQPLGEVPGAPPALARFAAVPPPTEAALRLGYAAAADAAHAASQPALTDSQGFFGRVWTRAAQSVTVREGDRVMVGDPIAGVLQHAREMLDAGDLAGAVRTLDQLAGPAKAAMAGWTGQAQALLDARAALAAMSARG